MYVFVNFKCQSYFCACEFRPVPDPGPGSCQISGSADKPGHPGIDQGLIQWKPDQNNIIMKVIT